MSRPPPTSTLFPYTTLFRSCLCGDDVPYRGETVEFALNPMPFSHVPIARKPASPHEPSLVKLPIDRKSTRLNSSHANISYAVFCLKKKKRLRNHHHCLTHNQ